MDRKLVWVGIGSVAVIAIAALLTIMFMRPASFKGTTYEPTMPAADIVLTDQNGNPFQSSTLRGKVTLVFFGYTNCLDECPVTMAKLRQAFDLLGQQSADAQVLLVTTDPARDNPDALKEYLLKFNPTFIGLTGTPEELQKTWADYGVAVLDDGETHSNRVYVIDRTGNLRLSFPYEMLPEEMASDLKILLGEK